MVCCCTCVVEIDILCVCVCVFRSLKALVTLLETADAAAQTADSFVVACCVS